MVRPTSVIASRRVWPHRAETEREIPEETPIAFVIDGGAEAVMMATPSDLQDFAYGFALNEGLIEKLSDIRDLDIVDVEQGIELRLWLADPERRALIERRRWRAGPTGCGLCGVESLEQALRTPSLVRSHLVLQPEDIVAAVVALRERQTLNQKTHAVHAAAFWAPAIGLTHVREDVGRHNALDKLAGALAREERSASTGAILMTSRVSVELVQKAAHMQAPILAAVSAPTALALRTAEQAGICVAGIVRDDGLEIFTLPERLGQK